MSDPSTRHLIQRLFDNGLQASIAQRLFDAATYAPDYYGATTAGATTYTTQTGSYVRIGSVVHVWGYLVWTAATGTGNARISLPFTAASSGFRNIPVDLRVSALTVTNEILQGSIDISTNYIQLESATVGPAITNAIEPVRATGNLGFYAVYPVA